MSQRECLSNRTQGGKTENEIGNEGYYLYIYILFFKGKQSSIGQESGNISLNKGNTDSSKISCA